VNASGPLDEGVKERADSRRKRLRLIAATRAAVAEQGLSVAAADIADRAEVGIGTLYRRFGSKEALIELVLLDSIGVVATAAQHALDHEDPVSGLTVLLSTLAEGQVSNRGLREYATGLGAQRSENIREHTHALRGALESLVQRAQDSGAIRDDVTWRDVAVLAEAAATAGHCLGVAPGAEQWRRTLGVIMDGLRPPGSGPLPGLPPVDATTTPTG
jgi:AcrR family transcriptional regulator